MCVQVYIYIRFYVKILRQTYFVRVGQNGLPFRLQLSRCARAALLLSPFCILCVSKSFLHVCANPFNMAPTAGYLQQLLLHSLNTLANILALPVDCRLPSSSFPPSCCRLPAASSTCCTLASVGLFVYSMLFFDFAAQLDFAFYLSGVLESGVLRGQTHLRITKRCFYMLNGKSNL